ncbi:MAG TPA: cisplatin damage response ATP-dependent DNA ligase [Paracoccaceae bacterium]|nr:cisplatin damage response ATP-dependent DNA ligase [Paracoccaceae bacterium]
MRAFAALLDRLSTTPQRNVKLRLLRDYLAATPDPDRGLALAAITRDLEIPAVKPALLRALAEERSDPVLFALSYDYVGDLAETISLIWEARPLADPPDLWLGAVVARLRAASRSDAPALMAAYLDALDPPGRHALIKLATGGLRIGAGARLAKQALADFGGRDVTEIEELWHALAPPYAALFAWLEGRAEKPGAAALAPFRPVMLAHPLEAAELAALAPADFAAEWKWDGIRVQATAEAGTRRLYSRSGEEVSAAFPDLMAALDFVGAIDGELLVGRPGPQGLEPGTFSDLQQRLNRKTVSERLAESHPVFIRAYDILDDGAENLRPLPFMERRRRLAAFLARLDPARFDLSPLLPFANWDELARHRTHPPHPVIEGVMLKRLDSPYLPGRPKGPWFKWKRDPFTVDAVLMYAQRGHGKRSSFYSDYTFGVWAADGTLVPVGKAYFGFSDEELKALDRYVRENTVERFGPVRAVRAEPGHGLVLEIAFEGLQRSGRHRSGLAMRFPRIARLRWDKPPAEADHLETLEALLPG